MRLSFIVVAFGKFSTLRTCLSSLLEQTSGPNEIIVCDNEPESDQEYMAAEIARMNPGIKYEWTADRTNISHLGLRHSHCLYTATEIGAKKAVGDFLAFPSADTYLTPVFAERMLEKAQRTGSDLVYCDLVLGRGDRPYRPVEAACKVGNVDKSSFILRRELFHGFPDKSTDYENADGKMIESLVREGISRRRLPQTLVFHN